LVNQTIKIRGANARDAALIVHLSKITFDDTFRGTCTNEDLQAFSETAFSLSLIQNELNDETDFYFIAFMNETPVGYMRLKEDYSDYPAIKKYHALELKRIYVLKEYHSLKVGAALMSYALGFASEKKFEVVWLGVWEHNERAKAFYKKWDFKDTGDKHDFPIGNTPQTDNWLIKFIKEEHTAGISL
jgi:ribosomal protein S18 acetylase RimI-like enzyme